jgi:hypothetical protein
VCVCGERERERGRVYAQTTALGIDEGPEY